MKLSEIFDFVKSLKMFSYNYGQIWDSNLDSPVS